MLNIINSVLLNIILIIILVVLFKLSLDCSRKIGKIECIFLLSFITLSLYVLFGNIILILGIPIIIATSIIK